MNLGSMMRSAHFFGVSGIVVSENSTPFNPITAKAASGAMDVLPVYYTKDIPQFLQNCAKLSSTSETPYKWRILGVKSGASSVECRSVPFDTPTILVIGNEGYGLHQMAQNECSKLIFVPGTGGNIQPFDSLNISNTVAILLHHFLTKPTIQSTQSTSTSTQPNQNQPSESESASQSSIK